MFTGPDANTDVVEGPNDSACDDTDFYLASTEEYSAIAGVVNAAYGRLVDLTVLALEEGHHVGPGLYSCGQYVAWQAGISKTTANRICRLAKRHHELPETLKLLRSGAISLDRADVIAQSCPAEYEQSAAHVALSASVEQLRKIVACYSFNSDPKPPKPKTISISRDDTGTTVRARLDHTEADLFEKALQTMRDDLFHQLNPSTASNNKSNSGHDGHGVHGDRDGSDAHDDSDTNGPKQIPSRVDALRAMCESVLQHGEAAHPGSERYLINYHLHATPGGQLCLTNQHGQPLPEQERQRLLCDHSFETVMHHLNGEPLSVGRKTRTISPKLRRAILFRDKHCCTVPGCDTSVGLEIHHIVHWEHGGSTNPENLSTLCARHHRSHHRGTIDITSGPSGVPFQNINPSTPVTRTHKSPSLDKLRQELRTRTRNRTFREGFGYNVTKQEPMSSKPTCEVIDRHSVHLSPNTWAKPDQSTPLRT